jgi:hypothetical protein
MAKDPHLPASDRRRGDAAATLLPLKTTPASFQGAVTTLVVEEEGVRYKVHKAPLCEASGFFTSASKEEWKEGQERRTPFPDDTSSFVDLYAQWTYTRRIVCRTDPVEEEGKNKYGEEAKKRGKNARGFHLLGGKDIRGICRQILHQAHHLHRRQHVLGAGPALPAVKSAP